MMVEIKLKDGVKGLPSDAQMPQRSTKAEETAYRSWKESMLYLVYGSQDKKTWNEQSRSDRWRVGQPR